MNNKKIDLIAGIVLALFSIWYYVASMGIKVFAGFGKSMLSSATMPKVWAVCMFLLAMALIVRSLRFKGKTRAAEAATEGFFSKNREVFATFGALFLYVASMNYVGFIISSAVYVFLQTVILMPKAKRNYKVAALIGVVSAPVLYYFFVYCLAVLLPSGTLFD